MTNDEAKEILNKIQSGELRAAQKDGKQWSINPEVEEAIIFLKTQRRAAGSSTTNSPPLLQGNYLSPSASINSQASIGAGAYVDDHCLIEAHVSVGNCAQIGRGVHLSPGVRLGGAVESLNRTPLIVEDDVFIGTGTTAIEGVQICRGAVIAPGVILAPGSPIFDCVNQKEVTADNTIPPLAVVVGGTRTFSFVCSTTYERENLIGISELTERNKWAAKQGLHVNCSLILKYRNPETRAVEELEKVFY